MKTPLYSHSSTETEKEERQKRSYLFFNTYLGINSSRKYNNIVMLNVNTPKESFKIDRT